jgi:hypothetical protein
MLCISLLSSCYPEASVVFYGEDTLSKELIISKTIDGVTQNSINSSIPISLLESDFFEQYIENLIELEVTSIEVAIAGHDHGVASSEIRLGNVLLENNMHHVNGSIHIVDSYKLKDVSRELLDHHTIPFIFSGDCASEETFEVVVKISFKGVFED